MAAFAIEPVERFKGASAAIIRPKQIACFSYDHNHEYHPDGRSLRYYYPPKIGANLSQGFDSFQQVDDTRDEHLDSLLKRIATLERETGQPCEADFVTWRGMITKIMSTPFDNYGSGFEMNATCFQGTIFIEEDHAYKLESRRSQNNQKQRPGQHSQNMMSFWGYKFETLCLLPDTWDATPRNYIENRETQQVDNLAQYCSIVKTGIGTSRLILGGEVDAVLDDVPEESSGPIQWVELKTSATIRNHRDMLKYERKLLKFWVQSFLLGVPKIIVGFRSADGILEKLETLNTQNIPSLVKKNGKSWDGNSCINFTAAFLAWLKETIVGTGVWRIRREDRSPKIEVFKVQEAGHGEVLSAEFLDWRQQQAKLA